MIASVHFQIVGGARKVVVAPAFSGKTHLADMDPAHYFDPDEARTPEMDERLKPLRHEGRWDEHNAIWHPALREAAIKSGKPVIFVHSLGDAEQSGLADLFPVYFYEVPVEEVAERMAAYADEEEDAENRLKMGMLNQGASRTDPRLAAFPKWDPIKEKDK